MERSVAKRQSLDWWWMVSTLALVAVYLVFVSAHFHQWRSAGRPVGLGLMVQETLMSALFVVRRRPLQTSRSPLAWVASGVGTFGMLAMRPVAEPLGGLGPLWMALQIVGVAGALACLVALGRSFGIVAANRGVQTTGPYRIVRHPMYASYIVSSAGYLLENPSPANTVVWLLVWVCQLTRIDKEEEVLSADPAYRAYRGRVRRRLIPFLY